MDAPRSSRKEPREVVFVLFMAITKWFPRKHWRRLRGKLVSGGRGHCTGYFIGAHSPSSSEISFAEWSSASFADFSSAR